MALAMYTVNDPVDAYCQHLANLGRSPATVTQYRKILVRIERELGHELLTTSPAGLYRLFAMGPWIQGLTIRTKGIYACIVLGYLTWAQEEELVERAPVGRLRRWQENLARPDTPEVTWLSMPEVEQLAAAFWEHSKNPERDAAILWVMAGAGGRVGETTMLRLNDVSLADQLIRFRHDTKGRSKRTVPMIGQTRDALRVWIRERHSPTDWLFPSWNHQPLNARLYQAKLHRVALAAGLQWPVCPDHGEQACEVGVCPRAHWRVHPHTLRHSFAVEALRSGACSLVELRDILGHRSVATTNQYANVVHDESATNRFKRRFGRG